MPMPPARPASEAFPVVRRAGYGASTLLSTFLTDRPVRPCFPDTVERMFAEDRDERKCSFPECNRAYYAKALCRAHYQQQLHKRPLQPIRPWRRVPTGVRIRRVRQESHQPWPLPCPCTSAEQGPGATAAPSLLWHKGSLPVRRLLETSRGWRLLRRARRPILRWAAAGSSLQAKDGMRFCRLHQTTFCPWLLPGSLASIAGEATASTPP
jgi:hypothetical protein